MAASAGLRAFIIPRNEQLYFRAHAPVIARKSGALAKDEKSRRRNGGNLRCASLGQNALAPASAAAVALLASPLAGVKVALRWDATIFANVNLPEALTERLPFLEPLEDGWRPVHPAAFVFACVFYGLFLLKASQPHSLFRMIDLVFIPIHEGGHLLFRFFGAEFLMVAGGTLFQLGVPLMLATFFIFQRQVMGTAFCIFFFFEQFLPIAPYMADARAQELPLLTVGDADYVIHDWNYMFTRLGVIDHDTQIAHVVLIIGWIGMFATVAWMIWQSLQSRKQLAGQ